MQKKFVLLIIILGFCLLPFVAKADVEGDYWCDIQPGIQGLVSCCFPKSPDVETYKGQECRADSADGVEYFLTNYSGEGLTCSSDESGGSIMTRIYSAIAGHRAKFNCFTGGVDDCYPSATYCEAGGGCIKRTKPECTEPTRQDVCPGGCGACQSDKVHCEGDIEYFNPGWDINGDPIACETTRQYCTEPGQTTANYCTGACEPGCGTGYTLSGDPKNSGCVTFKERFSQIFDDGLTVLGGRNYLLGGVELLNTYVYGSLGDQPTSDDPSKSEFYGKMFVEVDQADHLNWSSPSVPGPLRGLITGSDLFFCDSNYSCPTPQICTAGICNRPGVDGDLYSPCNNSSGCNLGLVCLDGQCADPNNPNDTLTACSYDDSCNSSFTCVQGYCHGDVVEGGDCSANGDTDCMAGLVCTADDICVPYNLAPPPVYFMGFSNGLDNLGNPPFNYVFNSNLAGYSDANGKCDAVYKDTHVCTVEEILTIFNTNPDNLIGIEGEGWINGGPPGYTANANDCRAWQVSALHADAPSYYGRYWDFNLNEAWLRRCTYDQLPFACCK